MVKKLFSILILNSSIFAIQASDFPEAWRFLVEEAEEAIFQDLFTLADQCAQDALVLATSDADSVLCMVALGKAYYRGREYEKTISYFDQAFAFHIDTLFAIAEAHYYYARALLKLDQQPNKMRQQFEKTVLLCSQHQHLNSRTFQAYALKYLGQYYTKIGDIQRAITYINQAWEMTQGQGFEQSPLKITCMLDLGIAYMVRADFSMALQHFQQGLSVEFIDPKNQAIIYDRIGETYMEMGKYPEAFAHQKKSIQFFTQLDYHGEILSVQARQAQVYIKMGLYEEAKNLLQTIFTSLQQFEGVEKSREFGKINLIAGDAYFHLKNYPMAQHHYQQALQAVVEDSLSPNPFVNPSIDMIYPENIFQDGLNGKGKSFLASYKQTGKILELQAAFSAFALAMNVDDSLRKEYSATSSKSLIAHETHWRTDLALEALSLLEKKKNSTMVDTVFALMEHSRAMDLYSTLIDAKARIEEGIPQHLQNLQQEQRLALSACESYWAEKEELLIDSACTGLRLQYDSLLKAIEKNYPTYRLKKFQVEIKNIAEIQTKMAKDEALIEYFWGKEFLYGLLLTKDTASWKILHKTSELSAMLTDLNLAQSSKDYLIASQLNKLYLTLLAPFGELPSRIILIPDNALHFLSFETLLTQPPDSLTIKQLGSNFWKGSANLSQGANYLLQDFHIQYAHSATLLYTTHLPIKSGKGVAAFAPNYGTDDHFKNNPIPPLNGNGDHALRLAQLIGGKAFIGLKADSTHFIQQAANYPLIHLALHGYADETNPLLAALAFNSTSESKGIMYAANLYGLPPLQAELVSLLSCETGAGSYSSGEGIMSLARAFRYTGANSVLMSLWQADTGPGMEIMESFYHYLDQGFNKSKALRQAKLDWLGQTDAIGAHPYKWANFVLIGQGRALVHRSSVWFYVLLGGFFLIGSLIGRWFYLDFKR